MYNCIKLKAVGITTNSIKMYIAEQAVRYMRSWTSTKGIVIESCNCPDWCGDMGILFTHGSSHHADNRVFSVRKDTFFNLMEAVHEYNEVHKD